MRLICCDKCRSINIEESGTESIETGHHWRQNLHYPWNEELVKEYDYYKTYKCKNCGFEFKEKN